MQIVKPLFAFAACLSTYCVVGATVEPAIAAEPVTVTAQRPVADTKVAIVKYGDLQLAAADQQKLLLRRVNHAVSEVCEQEGSAFEPYYVTKTCEDYAWRGARPQIASAIQTAQNGGIAAAALTITIAGR